ncbi:alpha/beta fold hydrolase [Leifsonia sp. YAF41]|uniref:alpha/beta fold hydrolase n=1 Tax=Leifsonia sp. YAF41 TaxID=3233086 RepID=UPI003F992665
MDIILVPGFWLDASSWSEVSPPLVAAGHRVHPLTLPGKESLEASRAGIGLQDHIDAVVKAIDALVGPVVLVGHSGGGAIIYGATDARPDRVARAIYVDSGPLAPGGVINSELPATEDEVPLPSWETFDAADLTDLTDELRAGFRARAIPEPRGVAYDSQQPLNDERRFDVPTTIIACEFPSAQIREWIQGAHPYVAELARIHDVEYVDLPTGHWPQFTRPAELGTELLTAVNRSADEPVR